MSPVFVQDADGCVVPAVVDSDGTPTEAFTAAVRKRRRPRVNLPDGPGVEDGKYTYHDPGTGRFAPYGFVTPSKLKALLNPDARKRKEVLGELQDKLDDNDPLLAEYVRALRQGDKTRARQIAAAIRRAVIGDRPAEAGDDRNAWDAGSREVAKLIPAAAKRADARGVHASNVPRNQIGMNPRVEAEAAAKERLAEMRNGGSLSVGRKVDFDEPEDAVDVNRPTAPGKVTAADVQPGDTVDGLRNVKGAHKVDTIRPDDSGAGYFIRLDGENEERFVHRDRLLTVTPGERTEPEPVDLIDTVEEQGGFTLDPRLGELVTEGIAVAVPGESAIIKADRFREDGEAERFIGDYIRKMRDDGLDDDVMIGAWYDREHDEIVLDRVQVFPDDQREEAIQAGRDRNEQAVYDLTNSNEIPTGGSGGREDIDIIGSDGDRTGEAVEGSDGRRDRPVDVPPGFQPATPDEVRDAARLNGTVRARVGNQGRMRRFAVGDEIEARYRDDEFADVWATTPGGKRRKYRVRWDRLDAFTETDASGARYGTPDQVKDAASATDGAIAARIADGRLSRLGLNAGDTIQVEYQNPHHGIVHVPTRDGGVRKYKVRWDRLDAHGGTADQATPTTPEPRGPKKKSGPASQANRDAKKARLTALAEEHGYTYEEIRDAERQVGQIKEAIRAEAKAAAYDALGQLELLGGSKLLRPPPKLRYEDPVTGNVSYRRGTKELTASGEEVIRWEKSNKWDWYERIDPAEDRRLRSRWMAKAGDKKGGMAIDELAGSAFNAGLTPDDSMDSAIGWYLETTARIDAAESLGRGRLAPGVDRVNLNDIAPATTGDARLDVTDLFGPQSIDDQILAVAAASRDTNANRGLDEESGYAMLGDTVHLPADEQPWTFTRDEWGAEADRLAAAATAPDATLADLAALENHIPQGVLDITTDDDDWGELYDWMAAAATAAGYDNVGTRGGAAEPEATPEPDVVDPGDATPPTPEPTPDAPEVEPTLGGPVGERVGYADWQATQPWNATLEQVEAGDIPWIVHNPGMSDWTAARWHDGRMEVPTRFFEGTDNELLVHHEVGHSVQKALFAELGDVAPLLAPFSNGTGFRSPFGGSDDPASHDNQPAEIVADAFAYLSTGTAGNFTDPGTDELFEAVAAKAAEMGFDLPSRDQRQAHHDWKQLPDGRWRRTPSDGNQVQVTEDDGAFGWTSFHVAADGTEKLDSGTAGSLTDAQSAADAALAVRQSADIIEEAPADAPEPDTTPGGPAEGSPAARIAGAQPLPYPIAPTFDGRPQAADEDLVSEMRAAFESAPEKLRVRVPPEVLDALSADGRWRTQFETGTTRGRIDFDQRRRVEDHRYGVAADHPDADRPVYGYVGDPISDSAAAGYGDIVFHVKPEVAGRTTVVFGDSLIDNGASAWLGDPDPDLAAASNGIWNRYTPKPGDPTDEDIAERRREIVARLTETEPNTPEFDAARAELQAVLAVQESRKNQVYTEAQFHGGLTLDDLSGTVEYSPKAHTWDNRGDLITDGYDALDAMATAHPDLIREVTFRTPADDRLPADRPLNPGDQMRAADLRRLAEQFAASHPGVTVNVSTAPNDPDTLDQIQVGVAVAEETPAPEAPAAPDPPGPSREGTMPKLPGESDEDYVKRVVASVLAEGAPESEPEPPTLEPVSGPNPRPNGQAMPYELAPAYPADSVDRDPAEYAKPIADVRAVADDIDQRLRVRIPGDVLGLILDDGRVRTMHETGTSRGINEESARVTAESLGFGTPEDVDPSLRPVYGYVSDGGMGDSHSQMYGDYVLSVQPGVADRTSVTWGDSLHPAENADIRPIMARDLVGATDRDIANASADQGITNRYIEAQIHGGLNVDELEPVVEFHPAHLFVSEGAIQREELRRVAATAAQHGWKLRIRMPMMWANSSGGLRPDAQGPYAQLQVLVGDLSDGGTDIELFNPDGSMPSDAPVEAPPAAGTIAP